MCQQSLQTNYDLFIPLYLRVLLSWDSCSSGSIEVGVSNKVEAIGGSGRPRVIKIDGVGSGLGPETSSGRASWDLLVHLLYISSCLTYCGLRVISGLRRELVSTSRVSDIHRLQPVRCRLLRPTSCHLIKEIVRNASRLLHYFLGDSIGILIFKLLVFNCLIEHVLRPALSESLHADFLR